MLQACSWNQSETHHPQLGPWATCADDPVVACSGVMQLSRRDLLMWGTMAVAGWKGAPMAMTLESSAFRANAEIPRKYTCEGDDMSPPLAWSGAPPGAKSFALIVDDPDAPDPKAPKTIWVHWVVYNLPASTHTLAEGVSRRLPAGARDGKNDWKRTGYGGPCPPIGRHRYYHKLYALDVELPDLHEPTKAQLESAMKGHILEHAELVGTYQKGRG